MSLDCGRKPEHPWKENMQTAQTGPESQPRSNPGPSCLLWGNSTNHCTTVPSVCSGVIMKHICTVLINSSVSQNVHSENKLLRSFCLVFFFFPHIFLILETHPKDEYIFLCFFLAKHLIFVYFIQHLPQETSFYRGSHVFGSFYLQEACRPQSWESSPDSFVFLWVAMRMISTDLILGKDLGQRSKSNSYLLKLGRTFKQVYLSQIQPICFK